MVEKIFLGMMTLVVLFSITPHIALASFDAKVSPAVIDGDGKVREILRYNLTVTNQNKFPVSLYPWVRDLREGGEIDQSDGVDTISSLSNWMQFSRNSIDLSPGDSVDIPLLIEISLRAKPGNYHAVIHFSNGGDRTSAEANHTDMVSTMVNIHVLEDVNERLQLGMFTSDENLFSGDKASFTYRVENIGNRGVVPSGKIHIYDRKGEEVAAIDANTNKSKLEPNSKQLLAASWGANEGFGRYKAMLDLEYGSQGTIQDTVFFWVLPWKKLFSLFVTLAVLCTFIAILFHTYTSSTRGGVRLATAPSRANDRDETYGEERRVVKTQRIMNEPSRAPTQVSPQAVALVSRTKQVDKNNIINLKKLSH